MKCLPCQPAELSKLLRTHIKVREVTPGLTWRMMIMWMILVMVMMVIVMRMVMMVTVMTMVVICECFSA